MIKVRTRSTSSENAAPGDPPCDLDMIYCLVQEILRRHRFVSCSLRQITMLGAEWLAQALGVVASAYVTNDQLYRIACHSRLYACTFNADRCCIFSTMLPQLKRALQHNSNALSNRAESLGMSHNWIRMTRVTNACTIESTAGFTFPTTHHNNMIRLAIGCCQDV